WELSKKPVRVDMLIIKKSGETHIMNKIGHIFRKHNLIEYKSPDDELSIEVFYKTVGYAGLYIEQNSRGNSSIVSGECIELSLSFFRHRKPNKLFKSLKNLGAGIEKYSDGIYYVNGIINIPIQVVVIRELPPKEHIVLKALVKDLSDEEARAFIKNSQGYTSPDDRNNADAVMQVSISANRELYELLQEEFYMCEALMDLMKDKVEKRIEEQVKIRVEERVKESILTTLYDLVKKNLICIKDAVTQAGISESAFIAGLKKYSV
ncbi:MAG: hypothetical protein IJ796_06175, partial [Lachnospiraceae bacterium]|nr:hypothetical protein [Lachnospiraceae bacterium]